MNLVIVSEYVPFGIKHRVPPATQHCGPLRVISESGTYWMPEMGCFITLVRP